MGPKERRRGALRAIRANLRVLQYLLDAVAWTVAIVVAVWLRYEFGFADTNWLATVSYTHLTLPTNREV